MDPSGPDAAGPVSSSPVILFDGVCNLCNGSVNFVIDRDPEGIFRFGSLQSNQAAPLLARYGLEDSALDSIVLIEDGRVYRKSDAVLRIARRLPGAWPLLYGAMAVPRVLRDAVYDWVARNRYRWFGRSDTCRVPTPELKARFL